MHVSGVVRAPILLCSNSLGSRVKYVRNGYRYIRRWSEGDTTYYNTGMFLQFGWMDGAGVECMSWKPVNSSTFVLYLISFVYIYIYNGITR